MEGRRRKANNPIKEIKKVVSCEDEEGTPQQPSFMVGEEQGFEI